MHRTSRATKIFRFSNLRSEETLEIYIVTHIKPVQTFGWEFLNYLTSSCRAPNRQALLGCSKYFKLVLFYLVAIVDDSANEEKDLKAD